MLDPLMRRLIDPPLTAAATVAPSGLSANMVTFIGLGLGLSSCLAVAYGAYWAGLVLLGLNRVADGLDGALARRHGPTDLGAYLDIVADFIIWALLPLSFAWQMPDQLWPTAVLLSSFAMSMTVFLAFAIIAEKRGLSTEAQGRKRFFYLAGLAEGTETILFFAFVMLAPHYYGPAAFVFAGFVYLSVLGRVLSSISLLKGA